MNLHEHVVAVAVVEHAQPVLPVGKVEGDEDHGEVRGEAEEVEPPDCARKPARVSSERVALFECADGLHCAAVRRHPQQKKSLQSPTLLTTDVYGMRYFSLESIGIDMLSS